MEFIRTLTALFFPERCPYCGDLIEPCEIACRKCYDEIRSKHASIRGGARGYRCVSSFVYDGKVRRMLLRLKYRDRTQFVPQITEILAADIRKVYGENAFDMITCVPMFHKDKIDRAYNQSELLAKSLSKLLDIPYRDTLIKVRKTKKQHKLKYTERKTNLSGAFQVLDKESIKGQRLLIIDDIITSGYTLGTCCKALSRAKPEIICCAAVASAQDKYPEATVI
ncbi:MAG: ComF family protein [Ruminococcus sp.]|nr:ComF family protein [Ruminococcus sp.]